MKISIVNYSEIKDGSDFRFDAEYYHPDCLKIHEKIKSKEHVLFFSKVKKIWSGKNLPQAENGNYKFIRTQNVRPVLISDTGMSSTNELEKLPLTKEGELLFVRVGEGVGDSCVITKKYSGNAVSDNVLRLKIEGINPFYCSIFFNSKIGQTYFKRNFKGTARGLISQENFKDILIPVFNVAFQEAIQNCVEESQDLIEESKYAYQLAQDFLLAELGLDGWKPPQKLWCEKCYLETVQAGRIDAEYYQPKYEAIINAIKSYSGGSDRLGNLAIVKGHNFTPKNDVEYRYIELSNIFSNGEVAGCTTGAGQDLPTRARRKVKEGDVIVSSIEGSLSSIALIGQKYNDSLCSNGFHVVKSDHFNSETLLVFLKSIAGQMQLKKGCTGTILTAINQDEFADIVLPKIAESVQQKIKEKVTESFKLRTDSKTLLEDAKRAVEIAIEQDETAAIQFLNSET